MPIQRQRHQAVVWGKNDCSPFPPPGLPVPSWDTPVALEVAASLPPKCCISSLSSPSFFLQIKMRQSASIPTDSLLGCFLKYWYLLDPDNLKMKHFVFYCNVA
jgi:hypothetical protein